MMELSDAAARPGSKPASTGLIPYRQLRGPRRLPILGNLHQVRSSAFHASLEEFAREFGPMYRFRMGRADCIVVSDAAVVSEVLRARPEAFTRSPLMASIVREMGLTGVLAAEGSEWRTQRLLVTRTFTPEVVRHFHPSMSAIVGHLLNRWQRDVDAGRSPDIARDLKAMSLDLTVAMAMGEPINSLESSDGALQADIQLLFEAAGRRILTPFPYWRYFSLPQDRVAEAALARVRERVRDIVERTRDQVEVTRGARPGPANLLEAMVAASGEPDSGFTDEMLIGNAMTMVFAGEDTTAASLAWALLLLAAHPAVARRLAEEADRVLRGELRLDPEQIDQLEYAEAVVHESMRLKPVAPMLPMCAIREQRVGHVLVPAGTRVLLLTRLAWQTSGQFDTAYVFEPERWLKGHGVHTASDPNRKMVPFGAGPRLCPGRYLAMVEMKAVLCLMAARFELVRNDESMVAERFAFTMKPDRVNLSLRARTR